MAVVKNLMVRAGADFSAITKQAKKASASMQSMSTSISASASKIRGALGAVGIAVSLGAIISAAKDAKEAYDKQAEAETKLAQVMRNTMGASSQEIKSIKELTAAQQALGVIGDEVQLAGAQELATYLQKTSTLKKLIPVMNDMVAQQYGFNATQESAANIATMLGKVMDGQVGALSRYGYKFDEAQAKILKYGTEEQRAATLAEVVEQSVGGMNAALANTPTGRMQQLSNTLGDIKESFGHAVATIGTAFLPLLNRVASVLSAIASLANRVAQAIANVFGKKLKAGTAAVSGGAGVAADALDDMAESAGGAGKAVKEAAKSVLGFDVLNKLSASNDGSSGGGGGGSAAGGGSDIGGFAYEEEEAAESATGLEKALQRIKDLVGSLDFGPLKTAAAELSEQFGNLTEIISGAFSWAFDNILTPLAHWTIEELAPVVVLLLAKAFEFLNAVLEKLSPVFVELYENHLKPFAKWAGSKLVEALKWVSEKFEDMTQKVRDANSLGEFINSLDGSEVVILAVAIAIGIVALKLSPLKLLILGIVAVGTLLYENWDKIKEAAANFSEKLAPVREAFQSVRDTVSNAVDKLREFWYWLTGRSYTTGSTTHTNKGVTFGGSGGGYASGGFPNQGELFLARESGPELVGSIGGRTAVANNDQIIEGIRTGVYDAMVEAILTYGGNRNSDKEIVLNIDGNTIARTVTKYQKMQTIAANV